MGIPFQINEKNLPFIPDAHTLLMVVQITEVDKPAPNAACLAGACPKFALRTFPKNTSCTSDGSTFALLRAAADLHNNLKHRKNKYVQKYLLT